MTKPFSYFNLIEAFGEPGCAACRLLLQDDAKYIDTMLYEYVNKHVTNDAFREGRGLCNRHAWMMLNHGGNALGVAILYDATLDEVLKIIDDTPVGGFRLRGGASLADRLEPTRNCLICQRVAESEKNYLRTLMDNLDDERMQDAYVQSDGLCLPHFRTALRQSNNAKRQLLLITTQRDIWRRLKAQVMEFMRKHNEHVDEAIEEGEHDSWLRALARMAGEEGAFGTRR